MCERLRAVRRGRPAAHRAPDRDRLPGRARRLARRRAGAPGRRARRERRPLSIGLLGNAAEVLPELVRRGVEIDVVTDQTSAHDPLNGYVPAGLTVEQADVLRASRPRRLPARASARARSPTWARSATCRRPAPRRSTTATRCAGWPRSTATRDAFAYPGFVPAYIRPLFCEGKGPFRWVALSGDPADIHATDDGDPRPVRRPGAHRAAGSELAREQRPLPGPAGAHLLARLRRAPPAPGVRFNEMVASRRAAGRRS